MPHPFNVLQSCWRRASAVHRERGRGCTFNNHSRPSSRVIESLVLADWIGKRAVQSDICMQPFLEPTKQCLETSLECTLPMNLNT